MKSLYGKKKTLNKTRLRIFYSLISVSVFFKQWKATPWKCKLLHLFNLLMILFIDAIKHNLTHQIFQQTVLLEQYSQSLASRTWQKMKAFTTDKSSEIFQEELQKIPTMFPAGVESSDHCKSCEKYKKNWKKTSLQLMLKAFTCPCFKISIMSNKCIKLIFILFF